MLERVAFGFVAACMLFSALRVASAEHPVRGVLWLAITLALTSVLYVMLGAPFVAGIQLLLYVGGVMSLMIFGVMLTRTGGHGEAPLGHRRRIVAFVLSASVFGAIVAAVRGTAGLPDGPARAISGPALGRALLVDHAVAFETLSVLLLAAMIGAIALTHRRRDARIERAAALPEDLPR